MRLPPPIFSRIVPDAVSLPAPSPETGSSTEDSSLAQDKPEDRGEVAALSQLFRKSARYRRAEEYKRFLDFVG